MTRLLRPILRFAGSVLAVTGAMLVTIAVVTVVWQEPVSAFTANREQGRLDRSLDAIEAAPRAGTSAPAGDARSLRRAAKRYGEGLREGSPFGRIALPTLDRGYVLIEGTDPAPLRKGPGHYPDTALPGMGRTVAIAGHRTTYMAPFRTIDRLRRGDRITIRMPYGRFDYEVARTRIVAPTAVGVTKDVGREQLVLTACHPLYSAEQRIVVFADLTNSAPRG